MSRDCSECKYEELLAGDPPCFGCWGGQWQPKDSQPFGSVSYFESMGQPVQKEEHMKISDENFESKRRDIDVRYQDALTELVNASIQRSDRSKKWFAVVKDEGQMSFTFPHATRASAETEAGKLTKQFNCRFYILEMIAFVEPNKPRFTNVK